MHKKIGILGGMSPESTINYYEHITRTYSRRHGDFGYPEIIIYSVNFQKYVEWQREGRWEEAAREMVAGFRSLKAAGADFGLIATNTMHIVFDEVRRESGLPLLSIVDATAGAIHSAGVRRVGLLGTVFTMRERFYREGLERSGIDVVVPHERLGQEINTVIYDELCRGRICESSRARFVEITKELGGQGAEGVVLGCTELPLLLRPRDCALPLFNTTLIHAEKALDFALVQAAT